MQEISLSDKVNKIVVCSSGGVHEKKLQEMGIKHCLIPDIAGKKPMDMLKSCRSIKSIIDMEQITIVHSHHRMAAFYAELVAPKSVVKVANAHNTFTDKKKLTQLAYRNTKVVAEHRREGGEGRAAGAAELRYPDRLRYRRVHPGYLYPERVAEARRLQADLVHRARGGLQ